MKRQAAAILIMAGLLCGCGSQPAEQTDNSQTVNETKVNEQKNTLHTLSYYIDEGTSIEDAASKDTELTSAVPFIVNGKFALADKNGVPITDAVYDNIECFNTENGIFWALYKNKDVTCISGSGKITAYGKNADVKMFDKENIVIRGKNKSSVYDLSGNLRAQAKGKVLSLNDDTLVSRKASKNRKNRWYITDIQTDDSISVKNVRSIGSFYNGSAVVKTAKNKWGIINTDGDIIRLDNIKNVKCSYEKYILAENSSGMFGVIDMTGKEIVPFEYIKGKCLSEKQPIFQFSTQDGKIIVLNAETNQKVRLPASFNGEKLTSYPSHYFSYTKPDGTVVLFDDIVNLSFDAGTELFGWNDNRIIIQNASECSMLDLRKGKIGKKQKVSYILKTAIAIPNDRFITVEDKITKKQGICDGNMKAIIDTEYDSIMPTSNGYFAAEKEGCSGLVNAKGEWVLRIKNR